ncbi:MAG: hypothetical protein DYG99_01300 [Bacteroidetes bacterium CHB5]|nr:hypothetical protein [Bacteroidetes bacterium CHB5]
MGWTAWAQQPTIQYWRPYDKRGVNVFETTKDDTIVFDGLKLRLGAGFTQGYQKLNHSNGLATPALYEMGGGFPLAQANFNIDVQLYDGISLNLVSYMSSHHHNEFWVKGGYLQIDKVGFLKSEFFDNLWKNLTLKVGHMEVNYGDAHFRRSDGGHTLWNPWIENNIMDAFTTEIGAELYWKKDGILLMGGFTDGEIQGNISNPSQPDGAKRKPSLYGKIGFDKQINDNLRTRITGSFVTTKSSASNTLYGGDRTGSNYQYVMENAPVTLTGNAFSGRFNPGFRDNVTAFVINPFVKYSGLEVFGTFEWAKGNSAFENGEGAAYAAEDDRKAQQTAFEALYRFGKDEQFYVGARYIKVDATIAEGYTAILPGTRYDVTIDRTSFGAGWFITRNILLKGEYVTQNYDGYNNTGANSRFYNGKFDGFVIQGAISF